MGKLFDRRDAIQKEDKRQNVRLKKHIVMKLIKRVIQQAHDCVRTSFKGTWWRRNQMCNVLDVKFNCIYIYIYLYIYIYIYI